MTNKHTPGPWKKTGQSEGGRYIKIQAANGRIVARVPFNTEREVEQNIFTDDHDADLITTAPELRAMLEAMTDFAAAVIDRAGLDDTNGVIQASRDLIARADGKG